MDEERRKNLVDRANDAYSAYRNVRNLMRLGRAAASAARTIGALAATSEIWIPIVVVGAVATVFILTFVIVLGSPGDASEIETAERVSSQEILGLFEIVGATETRTREIEDVLSSALSLSSYKNLLTEDGKIIIRLVDNLTFNGKVIDGRVDNRDEIILRSSLPLEKLKYTLLHETGHILIMRNGRIWQSFRHSDFVQLDSFCYENGYLKTYPVEGAGGGGSARVESFAEAVALFFAPKEPLGSFSNQCPSTYSWTRNNIFINPNEN